MAAHGNSLDFQTLRRGKYGPSYQRPSENKTSAACSVATSPLFSYDLSSKKAILGREHSLGRKANRIGGHLQSCDSARLRNMEILELSLMSMHRRWRLSYNPPGQSPLVSRYKGAAH